MVQGDVARRLQSLGLPVGLEVQLLFQVCSRSTLFLCLVGSLFFFFFFLLSPSFSVTTFFLVNSAIRSSAAVRAIFITVDVWSAGRRCVVAKRHDHDGSSKLLLVVFDGSGDGRLQEPDSTSFFQMKLKLILTEKLAGVSLIVYANLLWRRIGQLSGFGHFRFSLNCEFTDNHRFRLQNQ